MGDREEVAWFDLSQEQACRAIQHCSPLCASGKRAECWFGGYDKFQLVGEFASLKLFGIHEHRELAMPCL